MRMLKNTGCFYVCVRVVYEDINLYIGYDRYYKEKVIYEDIFSVPIIQKAYESYRIFFFWESKNAQSFL